jgi:hypothetical protein
LLSSKAKGFAFIFNAEAIAREEAFTIYAQIPDSSAIVGFVNP